MSIEILSYGPQPVPGASAWVDVSDLSTLRLTLTTNCDSGSSRAPSVRFFIETAETSAGRNARELWQQLYAFTGKNSPYNWQSDTRLVFAAFDNFVRVRWEGYAEDFTIGLAGQGLPESE